MLTASAQQFFSSNFSPAISVTEETKNKLDNVEKIKELIQTGNLSEQEFDYIVANDKDLKKIKSNFYKSAQKETTIESIEIEAFDRDDEPILPKQSIDYKDFANCIIPDEQETNTEEINAKIIIVAPVLIRGRKDHWKGIFKDESIEFKVDDKVFLENVYQHQIKFSNGTYIDCIMRIKTTTNTMNKNEKISRTVIDVTNWGDNEMNRTITKRKVKKEINTVYMQ
jgi:hypothetical protein